MEEVDDNEVGGCHIWVYRFEGAAEKLEEGKTLFDELCEGQEAIIRGPTYCCLQNRWQCRFWQAHTHILCTKLVRLMTHERAVDFTQCIYKSYLPRQALLIYQDRFAKSVSETVLHTVYLCRKLLHTAQLITQSKHVVYLSQSVVLVLGTY